MSRTRAVRALTLDQTDALLRFLGERLDGQECDGTTRHVERYLRGRNLNVPDTLAWLRHLGAWCDCEVWMNVR
jgi:hypothetical protein